MKSLPDPIQMIDVLGSKLAFHVLGDGPPVILLHGSLVSYPWKGFERRLAETYRVYVPQLPGFGQSHVIPNRRHDPELFAEALCEFIVRQRLEDAPLIAISFGGAIALRAALRGCVRGRLILVGLPGRVQGGIGLMSTMPLWLKRSLAATSLFRRLFIVPSLRKNVGTGIESLREHDAKMLRRMRTTSAQAIADSDYADEVNRQLRNYISRVTNEKVFVYGELDRLRSSTSDIAPDPLIIRGAGHNPFADQPDQLFAVLKGLLR